MSEGGCFGVFCVGFFFSARVGGFVTGVIQYIEIVLECELNVRVDLEK